MTAAAHDSPTAALPQTYTPHTPTRWRAWKPLEMQGVALAVAPHTAGPLTPTSLEA